MRRLRPTVRGRLLLTIVLVVAVAVAVLTTAFNVAVSRTLDREANSVLRARAYSEISGLVRVGNRLKVGELHDTRVPEARVWVVSRGRTLEGPPRTSDENAAVSDLAARAPAFGHITASNTRLYARPIFIAGRRLGVVVAEISLDPYRETRETALLGSIAFAVVLLLAVTLGGRWLLSSALQTVVRMTDQAAAWSETDLTGRFGLGEPRDELSRLAATLDRLLDRLAASLRREQRFSAELSHELRTPLAAIVGGAELALRRERTPAEYRHALDLIQRDAERLVRAVDTLVAVAQHEAGFTRGTADAYECALLAAESCSQLVADGRVTLTVDPPPTPLRIGVGGDLVVRILQPLFENACLYGASRATVTLTQSDGRVGYLVADDGAGVAAEERELIFEPGSRGSAAGANSRRDGAGLGLALARRLARSVDGDVEAEPGAGGRFAVVLPAG